MGRLKQKYLEKESHLQGSSGEPAIDGGYLYIYLNNDLLFIAGIPSPNLMAEKPSDSLVENYEEFTDKYDNNYAISIFSSIYDIYWELNEYPDDDNIINSIRYEVKYNEH